MKDSIVLVVLSVVAGAPAFGQITYDLNPITMVEDFSEDGLEGPYVLTGSITTDGTLGAIDLSNIVSIDYELNGPNGVFGQGSTGSGFVGLIATDESLQVPPVGSSIGFPVAFDGPGRCDFDFCELQTEFGLGFRDGQPFATGFIDLFEAGFGYVGIIGSLDGSFETLTTGQNDLAIRQGLSPGDSPTLPIFPSRPPREEPTGIAFDFENAESGNWFDPPEADSYSFAMADGEDSLFTAILDFPPGFDNPFEVVVDGSVLGSFGPGQSVDFIAELGSGVSGFSVRGISPLTDANDETAFPIQLAFDGGTASFTMTANFVIPEPHSLALALFACSVAIRRRR